MQHELGLALRGTFEDRLKTELPQFSRIRTQQLSPGSRLYAWECAPDLCFYIHLYLSPHGDPRFMVEIAWSKNRRFPHYTPGADADRLAETDELRFRLPKLWREEWTTPSEPWWWLGPEPTLQTLIEDPLNERVPLDKRLADVPGKVEDAVHQLKTYAAPYFRRVALKYGHCF